MKPPEIIYLQNPDEDDQEFWSDVTWCSDKINEHDVKYILSTPKADLAPDLLDGFKQMTIHFKNSTLLMDNDNRKLADILISDAEELIQRAEAKS